MAELNNSEASNSYCKKVSYSGEKLKMEIHIDLAWQTCDKHDNNSEL